MTQHFRRAAAAAATGYLILGCALAGTRLLMFTATGERKPTLRARLTGLLGRAWLWLASHGHGGQR